MHELSIAQRIVETIEDLVRGQAVRVQTVLVRVGAMSGVLPDALSFAWRPATHDTALAGSNLEIDAVPVTVYCVGCALERELPGIQSMRCPVCRELCPEVRRGRELEILNVEVIDDVQHDGSNDAGDFDRGGCGLRHEAAHAAGENRDQEAE